MVVDSLALTDLKVATPSAQPSPADCRMAWRVLIWVCPAGLCLLHSGGAPLWLAVTLLQV